MVTPFEVSQFEFRNLGIEKKMPFMPGIFFPEDQIEEKKDARHLVCQAFSMQVTLTSRVFWLAFDQ